MFIHIPIVPRIPRVRVNQSVTIPHKYRCGNPVHPPSVPPRPPSILPAEIPPKINLTLARIIGCKVPPVPVMGTFFILIVRMRYGLSPPTPGTPWKMTRRNMHNNNVEGGPRAWAPMVTHGRIELVGV